MREIIPVDWVKPRTANLDALYADMLRMPKMKVSKLSLKHQDYINSYLACQNRNRHLPEKYEYRVTLAFDAETQTNDSATSALLDHLDSGILEAKHNAEGVDRMNLIPVLDRSYRRDR